MAKKKELKKRADKYEEKVAVKGTFEDLLKLAVSDNKPKESDKSEKDEK